MDLVEARLAIMKMVYEHSSVASVRDLDSLVAKAKALEAYICQDQPKRSPGRPRKGAQQLGSGEPSQALDHA